MKKLGLVISFLMIFSVSSLFAVSYPVSNPNSWNFDYNPFKAYFAGMGGFHPGVDFDKGDSTGKSVYPIANGTIVAISPYKPSIGGGVVIKHIINGKTYYSVYYHVDTDNNWKIGTTKVYEGTSFTKIASITKFPEHLHLELRTSFNKSDWYPNDMGNGYYKSKDLIDKDKLIDPISFINNPINSSTSNKSIFDGAGSLVSPNEQCYGCDRDIAQMHPHSGANSTVVFQWLYDADSCSQLNISTEENLGDVIIKSKAWNGHLTKKAEKVELNAGEPITIKRPDSSNSWTTFAVTTTKPLDFSNRIYVDCKTSDDGYNIGTRSDADIELVDVTNGYFWSGTSSLISQATQRGSNQFGIDKDYAVTFENHKSLTSFQWYASSSCPKLKIRNARHENINSPVNDVRIKGWAEENWSSNKCSSTLPCTLDAPDGNGYYVIKVKSDADAVRFGKLSAVCVQ